MSIQTNSPLLKAKRGIPVDVIEEWLRENKKDSPEPLVSNAPNTHFNNVNTKHTKQKREKAKNPKASTIESLRDEIRARLLLGNFVCLDDILRYANRYTPNTVRTAITKAISSLRTDGFEVFALHKELKKETERGVIGWILESSLNKHLITRENTLASQRNKKYEGSYSPHRIYNATVSDLVQRLSSERFVLSSEYSKRHARGVLLRMMSFIVIPELHNNKGINIISIRCNQYKVGWIAECKINKLPKEEFL